MFLIVDRYPVHRAAKPKKFVADTEGAIELYYLPSYTSEFNRYEDVWS